MNHRRKFDTRKYLSVFALTTLIFIVGILIGNYFSGQKLKQIDQIGQNLKTDTIAMELQYDLIAEDPCSHVNSTPLADELYDMASKLDYMENRLGEDDTGVIDIKRQYSLLEMRHWLFMKKTIKECDQKNGLILFFYSSEKTCPKCKEQGFILTWARKNYADVYVYSFDYNIDNVALKTLKDIYHVNNTPAVIINTKTFNRFVTRDELEAELQNSGLEMIKE